MLRMLPRKQFANSDKNWLLWNLIYKTSEFYEANFMDIGYGVAF